MELDKSSDIDPGTKYDGYKLPAQVLGTAAHSLNVSYALEFDYNSDYVYGALDSTFEYYVYFHFAEIEQLPVGKKRIINITLNSENILSQPLVLEYLKPVTISHTAKGYVNFRISAASESDAPPILNAFEIYKLITELDSPTDARDGMQYGNGSFYITILHDLVMCMFLSLIRKMGLDKGTRENLVNRKNLHMTMSYESLT